jgi:hypothetical protein
MCGGPGTYHPMLEMQKGKNGKVGNEGGFHVFHQLVHQMTLEEFGRTTAAAACGKFVFAGSDTGAVVVWECGLGGVVERIAGWWLEGESISVVLPVRVHEQMFILVGMRNGEMYSFDTAGQLQ